MKADTSAYLRECASWDYVSALNKIAVNILNQLGEYDQAADILMETYRFSVDLFGEDAKKTIDLLDTLSGQFVRARDFKRAIEVKKVVIERLDDTTGPGSPESVLARCDLSWTHTRIGQARAGFRVAKRALYSYRQVSGSEAAVFSEIYKALGLAAENHGQLKVAGNFLQKRINILADVDNPEKPGLREALLELGRTQARSKKPKEAASTLLRITKLSKLPNDSELEHYAYGQLALADLRLSEDRLKSAESYIDKTHALRHENTPSKYKTSGAESYCRRS